MSNTEREGEGASQPIPEGAELEGRDFISLVRREIGQQIDDFVGQLSHGERVKKNPKPYFLT